MSTNPETLRSEAAALELAAMAAFAGGDTDHEKLLRQRARNLRRKAREIENGVPQVTTNRW